MNWLILMLVIGFVLSMLSLYLGYRIYKKEKQSAYSDFFGTMVSLGVVVLIILLCSAIYIYTYSEAVSLPYEYNAAIKNIEEMEEYLMRYETLSNESLGTIGQGLESLEYKQQIQAAIKEKNKIYAEICSWLNNWWSPYKDVVISGLPPGDYGMVTI